MESYSNTATVNDKARAWDVLMAMWEDPDSAEDLVELIGDLRAMLNYSEDSE